MNVRKTEKSKRTRMERKRRLMVMLESNMDFVLTLFGEWICRTKCRFSFKEYRFV